MLCVSLFCYAILWCTLFCYAILSSTLLCYAMLYSAMFRYAMQCFSLLCSCLSCSAILWYSLLCNGMPYFAMLCYAMLCNAILCYAMLCYTMLCYAILWYAMLCYATLCCGWLCSAMLCRNAMLCSVFLCYALLCHSNVLLCSALLWWSFGLSYSTLHVFYSLNSNKVEFVSFFLELGWYCCKTAASKILHNIKRQEVQSHLQNTRETGLRNTETTRSFPVSSDYSRSTERGVPECADYLEEDHSVAWIQGNARRGRKV